jgi:hypothetical protein
MDQIRGGIPIGRGKQQNTRGTYEKRIPIGDDRQKGDAGQAGFRRKEEEALDTDME